MYNWEFKDAWILWFLLLLPMLLVERYWHRDKKKNSLQLPSLAPFEKTTHLLSSLGSLLFLLRLCAFTLLIIAMARPRTILVSSKAKPNQGIDIMLAVDVSLSMLARDLQPDRLTALKSVAKKFVEERPSDRIGLVAYSGEGLTKVPLTTDKVILQTEIEDLRTQELQDGTAIGIGLATAINHLKDSKAKSKVIILMTDGVESIDYMNNLLYVSPRKAAEIAAEKGIKTYTIGIGTNGFAPFPVGRGFTDEIYFENVEVKIDEELLQEIAQKTGGKYFRATDNNSLATIYNEINRLEKSEINEIKYYNYTEMYRNFLIPALILLLLDFVLRSTIYKEFT